MKSLPAFSIESWDKTEQGFRLVAWREREQKILLLDADRSPKILRPLLPQLDQKGWHYISNPYPDAQPVRMEAVRLLCPPCRGNAQEAAKINAPADPAPLLFHSAGSSACEWEKAWVKSGDEVLWPKPDDAPPLRALVEQFTARKRTEYEARKQKLAKLTVGEFQYLQITKQVDGLCAFLPADSDKHGKSEVLNHCMVDLCWQGDKALICSLEVQAPETYRKLIRMTQARRHVCSPEDKAQFRERCLKPLAQKIWVYDAVGNADIEDVLAVMLYAYQRFGCRQFVLD